MKIVVLINQNLNRTNFERFNLKLNKQSHLNIKYWCILPLYNNDLFIEYEKKEYRPKKDKNFINLKSYLEIYKNLKKINKDTYFLNQSGDNFQSFLIGLVMRLKGCKILKKIEYYNCTTNQGSFLKRLSRLYEFGLIFTLTKILKSFFSFSKNIFLNVFTLKPDYYIIENSHNMKMKTMSYENDHGHLTMSRSWFEKYVVMAVINKENIPISMKENIIYLPKWTNLGELL